MQIHPLSDRVLLRGVEAETTTKSGIILSVNAAKERPNIYEVIAFGPGRVTKDGTLEKIELSIGDRVLVGPKGRNVVFPKSYGAPQVTNDGVTIAKEFDLEDPIENMGAELIKDVASKTNDAAGDGTTTATVLTYAMISEGLREIRSGINAIELKNGMKLAASEVSKELTQTFSSSENFRGNRSYRDYLCSKWRSRKNHRDAMDKVKRDGVITVEEGKTFGMTVTVTEGMQFKNGFVAPYMITDAEKMEARYTDVPVLITDKKISSTKDILKILESLLSQWKTWARYHLWRYRWWSAHNCSPE
jgi:chaperonin GroEL